jgi:signal transduction histidine kinase
MEQNDSQHSELIVDIVRRIKELESGKFDSRQPVSTDDVLLGEAITGLNNIASRLEIVSRAATRTVQSFGVKLPEGKLTRQGLGWTELAHLLSEIDYQQIEMAKQLKLMAAETDKARAALYERHRDLHLIIESMPNLLLIIDEELTLNAFLSPPRFPRILRGDDFSVGRSLEAILPEDLALPVLEALWASRSFGRTETFEYVHELGDRAHYFEVKTSPIIDSENMLLVMNDISERREAELSLMRMKDEFVASASHELRTPIYAIKGFLDLLRTGRVEDPITQKEFLNRASESTDRLIKLIQALLDVTRLESGHFQLSREGFDLNTAITRIVSQLEALAAERSLSLQSRISNSQMRILADRLRIEQVITNLIGNAIKFSPAGSEIRVEGDIADNAAIIKVIDQGIGIREEDKTHMFEKFFQADGEAKRVGSGSGLGLYISQMIVEAHGGSMGLESEFGKGSTFYFTLPLEVSDG